MRKKLPILLLVLTILMQAFAPVAYAASKNEEQFQTAYFCASDTTSEGAGEAGTLSNVEARQWYLQQEAKIPDLIDKDAPLEARARQAFELRNQFRTEARAQMADRH